MRNELVEKLFRATQNDLRQQVEKSPVNFQSGDYTAAEAGKLAAYTGRENEILDFLISEALNYPYHNGIRNPYISVLNKILERHQSTFTVPKALTTLNDKTQYPQKPLEWDRVIRIIILREKGKPAEKIRSDRIMKERIRMSQRGGLRSGLFGQKIPERSNENGTKKVITRPTLQSTNFTPPAADTVFPATQTQSKSR